MISQLARDGYSTLCIDLNTTPDEATYQLLTSPSRALLPIISREIEASRFVHTSVDNIAGSSSQHISSASVTGTDTPTEKDDEDESPVSSEQSVANTREPQPSDGIVTVEELVEMARTVLPEVLNSAYDSSDWAGRDGETFEKRGGFNRFADKVDGLEGRREPGYTCFTPLFKLTLGELLSPARRNESLIRC